MGSRRLVREVLEAGRRNSRAAVLLHSNMADRLGLNATDVKGLDLVMEHGPMTPGELARATGLSGPAVTAMLDRLESRGMVVRSPDPGDRRRVRVSSVPSALEEMGSYLVPFLHELAVRLEEQYDDQELAAIARFLREGAGLALEHVHRWNDADRS